MKLTLAFLATHIWSLPRQVTQKHVNYGAVSTLSLLSLQPRKLSGFTNEFCFQVKAQSLTLSTIFLQARSRSSLVRSCYIYYTQLYIP